MSLLAGGIISFERDWGSFITRGVPDVSYWEQMDAVPKK